ncbi:uncharacterized protein LOC125047249 [Penaeus chinensis]|uniref:uncharacterized protein LOC125047249 n=1 Tax=Penaeus chinensis TaxID=139456 RepID=UPI001FB73630|nr:uncharacterized protein LOC125047249 [Penaeus chinensis]
MATNDVVFHPSEITQESVEAALKNDKGSDARLVSFTVQECTKKGDNYATFVARVNVKFSSGKVFNTTSYIVKYNPNRFKLLENFTYISFQKEQVFYQQLVHLIQSQLQEIDQIPLKVPKCFYTSQEENREVIFLEDLQPRGFRMFDRKKGMDVGHTKLVLEELARLHAASYVLKSRIPDLAEKCPILKLDYFNYGDNAAQTIQGVYAKHVDMVQGMLNTIGGYEVAENWLARNKTRGLEIMENQLQRVSPFDVLCHGDCWINNVLFRYEDNVPVEVMLLDFQLCRQASLATDLSFLLHTSLEGHVRKTNLETFLDIYFSTFFGVTEAGKTAMPFSRQELRQEYRNRLEYGLLMSLFVNILILCGGEINGDDPEGYSDSMKDMLNEVSKSSLLHSRFLSVFDEMIENKVIV